MTRHDANQNGGGGPIIKVIGESFDFFDFHQNNKVVKMAAS